MLIIKKTVYYLYPMNSNIKQTPPPSIDGKLDTSVFVKFIECCSSLKYSKRYEPLISLGWSKMYLIFLVDVDVSEYTPAKPEPRGPLSTSDDIKYIE